MASIADMSSIWMALMPNRDVRRFLGEGPSMKNLMIVCAAAAAMLGCGAEEPAARADAAPRHEKWAVPMRKELGI